jgi:hypothetical protein
MMQSKIIRAEANVPLELAYRDAEPVQGNFGDQVKYTLVDGRITYLDANVAAKIDALGIEPGQPFTLLKRKDGRAYVWQITPGAAASPAAPHHAPPAHATAGAINGPVSRYVQSTASRSGHGQLAVPKLDNGNGHGQAPAAPGNPLGPPPGPAVHQGQFQYLIEQTQGLIDAYGALLAYSEQRHGNRIKPDDVRALLTTMFINCKGGR